MHEKILFIELFQSFAQYRNPFTFYYAQTYPLPPKSTVIGMLQNACNDWYGADWWDLKVSIHGGFESFFWNYQTLIKGDTEIDESGGLFNKKLPLYGEGVRAQRTPVYQQELFNGHLYIFLRGNEELIDKAKENFQKPKKVFSLGRSEDVVFIKDVKLVEAPKPIKAEGDLKLTFPTYILRRIKQGTQEINFPIKNKKYPTYSIPIKITFKNNGQTVRHKAEITKNTEREVEFASVIYSGYDYSIILDEGSSLNVEVYSIGDKKIRIIGAESSKDQFGWL